MTATAPEAEMTPREAFEALGRDLGLAPTSYSSDKWVKGFLRRDGLHLWPIASSRLGVGIQTAVVIEGRYANHQPFATGEYMEALRRAVARELTPEERAAIAAQPSEVAEIEAAFGKTDTQES